MGSSPTGSPANAGKAQQFRDLLDRPRPDHGRAAAPEDAVPPENHITAGIQRDMEATEGLAGRAHSVAPSSIPAHAEKADMNSTTRRVNFLCAANDSS